MTMSIASKLYDELCDYTSQYDDPENAASVGNRPSLRKFAVQMYNTRDIYGNVMEPKTNSKRKTILMSYLRKYGICNERLFAEMWDKYIAFPRYGIPRFGDINLTR